MRHALLGTTLALAAALLTSLTGSGPSTADAGGTQAKRRAPRMSAKQFARVELGRRLFFDPQASPSGKRSCASCHAPDHGWSDPDRVSADDVGDTRRHSQTILDAAFNPSAHWDGEFDSVEALVVARLGTPPSNTGGGGYHGGSVTPRGPRRRGPITKRPGRPRPGGVTPGGESADGGAPTLHARRELLGDVLIPAQASNEVPVRIEKHGRYDEAFRAAFGSTSVSLARIAQAVAAFVHSVESTTSPYDRYRAGDEAALGAAARRGLQLFEGRAGCASCHLTEGEHPLFTDFAFHNSGVAWHDTLTLVDPESVEGLRLAALRKSLHGRTEQVLKQITGFMDQGRAARTGNSTEVRAFKTPTLRDVAQRGPYMHNGRFETLDAVVRYYAKGCGGDLHKDVKLRSFEADAGDIEDLVAFLESLSGATRPGLAAKVWSKRSKATRIRFVDVGGRALGKVAVTVIPVGDTVPVENAPAETELALETSREGWIRFRAGTRTHTRLVLPEGLPLVGGELVPDTCRVAQVTVPVAGRMTFIVRFPKGAHPPRTIVGHHRGATLLRGHEPQRTRFERVSEPVAMEDVVVAKYVGWARTDVGHTVTLLLPGRGTRGARTGRAAGDLTYGISAGAEIMLDLSLER